MNFPFALGWRYGSDTRFRRLAKDYERLAETLAGLHLVAFSTLILHRLMHLLLGQNP